MQNVINYWIRWVMVVVMIFLVFTLGYGSLTTMMLFINNGLLNNNTLFYKIMSHPYIPMALNSLLAALMIHYFAPSHKYTASFITLIAFLSIYTYIFYATDFVFLPDTRTAESIRLEMLYNYSILSLCIVVAFGVYFGVKHKLTKSQAV